MLVPTLSISASTSTALICVFVRLYHPVPFETGLSLSTMAVLGRSVHHSEMDAAVHTPKIA